MRRVNKKKCLMRSGFTLLEIVLTMAILLVFISVIYSTFYIVNASHANIAVINDAKDFAAINMQAIENLTANASSVKISSDKFLLSDDKGYTALYYENVSSPKGSVLTYHKDGYAATAAFSLSQYKIDSNTMKWSVKATFTNPSKNGIVNVKLEIVDNSTGDVYYTLQKDIYFLNINSSAGISGDASGWVLKFKSYTP